MNSSRTVQRSPDPDLAEFRTRYGTPRSGRACTDGGPVNVVVLWLVVLFCTMSVAAIQVRAEHDSGADGAAFAYPSHSGSPAPKPAPSPTPDKSPYMTLRKSGTPVAWICGPIGYRLVLEGAPPGARDLVHQSIARIADVSGYEFVEHGPLGDYEAMTASRGEITIAWVSHAEFARETDNPNAVGVGGPSQSSEDGGRYIAGRVWLLRDDPALKRIDFSAEGAGPILLHELGHALGLTHSSDERAVMFPTARGVSQWSPTEVEALTTLRLSCDAA
jgi:hypothetical protein